MMMCDHEDFRANVAVARVENGDGDLAQFVAEVQISCVQCGERFGFRGPPAGHSWHEPRCSVDALELHAPLMSPAELALSESLPALNRGPMIYEVDA